jgi:hypothetical protein
LAAGQLMGKATEQQRIKAGQARSIDNPRALRFAGERRFGSTQRIENGFIGAEAGIEAAQGVLKDHLDAVPDDRPVESRTRNRTDILAVEFDLTFGLIEQSRDHARERGLTASGFSDDA